MERQRTARLTGLAPVILPALAILAARGMTYTDWAAANAALAALLFAWVVADSLVLATIAKAPDQRPAVRVVLGAAALAGVIIVIGAAEPVRMVIVSWPPVLAAIALTVGLYALWTAAVVIRARSAGASPEAAAELALPPKLVRFLSLELRIMHLALLGWRRGQDIPVGAQAFGHPRSIFPMIDVFLGLQLIELAVMHVLLLQWSAIAAWIWSALGAAGALWAMGLAQAFRIHPVLLTDEGLRVRSGILVDAQVPYGEIARVVPSVASEQVTARDTLNHGLLAWPNIMLELHRPIAIKPLIGAPREVVRIALRIDDSAEFLAALNRRIQA